MTYRIIPITRVSEIKDPIFTVWNEAGHYLTLDETVEIAGTDHVYEIVHVYKGRDTKTYYVPVVEHKK